jgi:hypothetical protein
VFEEAFDLKFRIAGIVFGPAWDKRFAVPGHGERIDGKEHKEIISDSSELADFPRNPQVVRNAL